MKKERIFYSELAYVIGLAILAFGNALMEWADFGMSMVVAPAYLLHLALSPVFPFFSFGVSEYVFQALLLILLSLVMRGFKKSYLFSFFTALIYGFLLDFFISIVALFPFRGIPFQVLFFIAGMAICSIGVALLFRTYLSPQAYDLMVKEIADKFNLPLAKTKTVYDCCSCLLAIILSFAFFGFGEFVGVKAGTLVCTLLNGFLIGRAGAILDRLFIFRDALPLRNRFS